MSRAVAAVASGGRMRTIFKKKDCGRDVDIAVLIDQSGSMSGNKVVEARECAITFAESLREVGGVKLGVFGFWSAQAGGYTLCRTVKYKDFDSQDTSLIGSIDSHDCNRDGFHIRFVGNELVKRSRAGSKKVFIMLSDGEPSDYSGHNGELDVKNAVNELKAQGVSVICVGFDINAEHEKAKFARMYGTDAMAFVNVGTGALDNVFHRLALLIVKLTNSA
jgi:nitric oxide reductase activation protein